MLLIKAFPHIFVPKACEVKLIFISYIFVQKQVAKSLKELLFFQVA